MPYDDNWHYLQRLCLGPVHVTANVRRLVCIWMQQQTQVMSVEMKIMMDVNQCTFGSVLVCDSSSDVVGSLGC
jgi:hypothetical protein